MPAILNVYPSPLQDDENNDYLAVLKTEEIPLPDSSSQTTTQTRTIIILDNSGSMCDYVKRCCRLVFPAVFKQLDYPQDELIDLILFESDVIYKQHAVSEFPTLPYESEGGTDMRGVFPILTQILRSCEPGSNIRLLTVSDGDVCSQEETVQLASQLNDIVQNELQLSIDSIALRLFTSAYANPDTRAVSSLLTLNTTANIPNLIDIEYAATAMNNNQVIIEKIFEAFSIGAATAYLSLPNSRAMVAALPLEQQAKQGELPDAIFKAQPWAKSSIYIPLTKKSTLLWLSKSKFDPTKHTKMTISDVLDVNIVVHDVITQEIYEELISTRVNYYMMQIKLLRVVGTASSIERLKTISDYFVKLEEQIYKDAKEVDEVAQDSNKLQSLKQRVEMLKNSIKKTNARLSLQMQEIANMDATTQFNAAQAASFLRSTSGSGAASRGLVRRAGVDLDFDSIVRGQVKIMAKKLPELEAKITPEMEESFHQSFVSLASTMDGIRTVCALATTNVAGNDIPLDEIDSTESILDQLPAFEILTYLNIVGIPVQSTIGDYPDPSRYSIATIFSGHYASLSDLMVLHSVNEGQNGAVTTTLNVPGYKGDEGRVDNIIPFFETPEIFTFLYKYAPSTLNLYAGIGMRRVLADIPGTLPAMLSAALLKMMRVVVVEGNEVNFKTLKSVYHSLTTCSTIKYNTERFDELTKAVINVNNTKLGNNDAMKEKLDKISSTVQDEVDDNNKMDQNVVVQLGNTSSTINLAQYKDTMLGNLPSISTQLSQLALPLIQLFMYTLSPTHSTQLHDMLHKNDPVQDPNAAMDASSVESPMSTHNITYALPAIMRSVYINEAWMLLRSEFRNKPNSTQIIEDCIKNLVGFDNAWAPQLTDPFSEDGPFEPQSMMPHDYHAKNEFITSKLYKTLQGKLNRFNILLAFPYFAQLFIAYDNNDQQRINELQSNAPKVLSTPETISLLQKQKEYTNLMTIAKGGAADNNNDDDMWEQFGQDDNVNDNEAAIAVAKETLFGLNAEREETQRVLNDVVNTLVPKFYFGIDNNEKSSYDHTAMMKFYAIITTFVYPQPSDRVKTDNFGSLFDANGSASSDWLHLADFDHSPYAMHHPYIVFLTKYRTQLYQAVYDQAIYQKRKNLATDVGIVYRQQLLDASSMEEFHNLLQNGRQLAGITCSFKNGFQDNELHHFWKQILDAETLVNLRLEKLRVIILGRDVNNNPIWNKGRILYDHKLHDAAHFFYDAGQRDQWIAITNEYKNRRAWEYRPEDLPNRHGHHLSHPSYYGFGYDTLADYKAAVSEQEYRQYCEQHKDCCGLTPIGVKRQRLGPSRHSNETLNKLAQPLENNMDDATQ